MFKEEMTSDDLKFILPEDRKENNVRKISIWYIKIWKRSNKLEEEGKQ